MSERKVLYDLVVLLVQVNHVSEWGALLDVCLIVTRACDSSQGKIVKRRWGQAGQEQVLF